ncbi:MAG TPA: hypothetical protein VI391_05515 [Thermoanaerobaculia bacterium]
MRRHATLFILGVLLMWFALMLTRIAGMPDFFSGLVYGTGTGALFLFVWKNGRRARSC